MKACVTGTVPGQSSPDEQRGAAGSRPSAGSRQRWFTAAGGLVTLLALAVRLPRLADHSVWWDEGFAIYLARLPLLDAAYRTAFDVHPPAHYWFLHFWIRLVGESEFAVRYSSVLFAVLAVALLAWAGRALASPATGLLASLFLALARLNVEWSQEMRMYTVATGFVALLLYFGVGLCVKPSRRRWAGLVLTGAAALYTLYIAGLALLAIGIGAAGYGIATRPGWLAKGSWVGRWLVAATAVTVLYSPWLIVLSRTPRPAPRILWTLDPLTYVWAYLTVMPLGLSTYLDRYLGLTCLSTVLLLIGIAATTLIRERRPLAVICVSLLIVVPASVYLLSLPNPIFFKPNLYVRYLLILLPAYDLMLACSVVASWKRWRAAGVVAGCFLLGASAWALWTYYPTKVKVDDYASLVRFISSHAQAGDEIVLYPDRDWPIVGYYNHSGLPVYGVGTQDKLTAATATRLGQALLAQHPSLWLVSIDGGHDSDPSGYLATWLSRHTREVGSLTSADRRVQLLTRDPTRTLLGWVGSPERLLDVLAKPGIRLVGEDLAVREVRSGASLDVALYWQAAAPTSPGSRAMLWLAEPGGRPVVARSWPLALRAGQRWREDYLMPVPKNLPAGAYRLVAGVRGPGEEYPASAVTLDTIRVDSAATSISLHSGHSKPVARFGSVIALDRIDLWVDGQAVDRLPALRPGDRLALRLHWRALRATDRRYTVFVHLIGPLNPATRNPIWDQRDRYPVHDTSPTDTWLPGQTIVDDYHLAVPATAPPGPYSIELGLYQLASGRRVIARTASGSTDHVVIAGGP